jgi:MFS family permease
MMAPQTRNPKNELYSLYAVASLFSGGRLFVGAISVLYVLSHGIGIAEFALIKSLQVATFLIFDIPSGLFIKRFGYKNSLITTFILSILGLSIYIFGNSVNHFLIAEFFTALSLCCYPTAFTDYTMDFLKRNQEILMEKVFHRSDMFASIATLICGGLGGYLFNIEKTLPYYAGIALQLFAFFLIFKINSQQSIEQKKQSQTIIDSIKNIFYSANSYNFQLLIPILILFVIQLTIQPLYHYWQPLFYEIDEQISGNLLGFVFVSYSLCAIFLNFLFSKISQNHFFRSINCIFLMLLVSTVFYFISATSNSLKITIISFTLLQGILFPSLTCISAIINRHIDDQNRPVTLKLISFLSRIGMLISFGCIQLLSNVTIHNLYLLSASILCTAIIGIKLLEMKLLNYKFRTKVNFENVG